MPSRQSTSLTSPLPPALRSILDPRDGQGVSGPKDGAMNDECIIHPGPYDRDGYARTHGDGAHRLAWVAANGRPVPDGLCVLHSCDTPPCVNPAHLWVGTRKDNHADAVRKGRMPKPPHPKGYGHPCPWKGATLGPRGPVFACGHSTDNANTRFRGNRRAGCLTCCRAKDNVRRLANYYKAAAKV